MLPYAIEYIPSSIRRAVAPYLPIPQWGKMLNIVDAMDTQSTSIFHGKRQALEKGDEAVALQIGEGRDIMSILSKLYDKYIYLVRAYCMTVKANMQASEEDRLPEEEVIGQVK